MERRAAQERAEKEAKLAEDAEREARELEEERDRAEALRALHDAMQDAFGRGTRYAKKSSGSGCNDPLIRSLFRKQCRQHGRSSSGKPSSDDESAAQEFEPARETPGGCANPSELFVEHGAEPAYASPESHSGGRIDSCSVSGIVSWCVDPEVWRWHKAEHGPPPPIPRPCWTYE